MPTPPPPPHRAAAFGSLDVATPELIRSVVDNVPTLIAYFDDQLVCRYANASYRRVFEAPGQPLEGAHFESLVLPSLRAFIMPRARAALTGVAQVFEYERPAVAGGKPMHVEVKYTPNVRDGTVRGMFVELHDISSHKYIESLVLEANRDLEERVQERTARLFDSEQRFRLMVDALHDYCIYFVDDAGHITDWTESAQRMHHLDAHQVLRQHFGLLMDASHPGRNPGTRSQLVRQAIDGGQAQSEGWQIRHGQSAFWAHSTFTALRDSRGGLQGLSIITKDMTATKRLEDVMHDLNQDLVQRVQERTCALTAANRDIDAFSHMVSHDLRAPLRHLSGYLMLLRDDLQPVLGDVACDAHTHLDAAEKSTQRLARMIEGVLDYARLGRSALELVPVDLEALIRGAAAACPDQRRQWQIASDWPLVLGDAALLGRLVAALLSNAVKFTRDAVSPLIEIGWELAPVDPVPGGAVAPLRGVRWWVRDNGVGFDSSRAQHMFVMFQRQHHSMDFEGEGVELALCQRIVTLHGGTIRIESQHRVGCTVEVTIPVAGADPPIDIEPP